MKKILIVFCALYTISAVCQTSEFVVITQPNTFALSRSGAVKIKKSTPLSVKDVLFETEDGITRPSYYSVEYKGETLKIRAENVMQTHFAETSNMYCELYSQMMEYKKRINQELSKITQIYKDSVAIAEQIAKEADAKEKADKYNADIASYFTQWPDAKKYHDILSIDSNRLSNPNNAGGCDLYLSFTNKSDKTIKYIKWEGLAYNAVDDPVKCEIRRTSLINGKITGPIYPAEIRKAEFPNVIYNYSAKYITLVVIDIDYTDGSHLSIPTKSVLPLAHVPKPNVSTGVNQKFYSDVKRLQKIESIIMRYKYAMIPKAGKRELTEEMILFEKSNPKIKTIREEYYSTWDTFEGLRKIHPSFDKLLLSF